MIGLLRRFLRPYSRSLVIVVLLLLVQAMANLFLPTLNADIINKGVVTGDIGYMDADGYFHYQSRTDDMIISAGYNIGAPEVEQALLTHPAVAEAAVVARTTCEAPAADAVASPIHASKPAVERPVPAPPTVLIPFWQMRVSMSRFSSRIFTMAPRATSDLRPALLTASNVSDTRKVLLEICK